jgi:glycosyltransferase involved in cell wall biosynthesis
MLLSICIPTYKRESYIDLLLAELAFAITEDGLEGSVEVVVLDNSSPDQTWDIITRHADRSAFIRPIKNKVNIGAEANVIRSLYEASGTYTWLLSDHQTLMPGKLLELVSLLRESSPDFCCVAINQWTSPLSISGKVFELGQLSQAELGALLFTWGNISSLLGKTEYFMSSLRRSIMIACYNYPHLSFLQDLSRTTRVAQLKSAIEFRSLGQGTFVRNYDPYRPCFINNILIVKDLIEKTNVCFSVSSFQTVDYQKAFAVDSIRLLVASGGSFWGKLSLINGAFWANRSSLLPNKIFMISAFSFGLMMTPRFFRRLVLVRLMSFITPGSGLLLEIKNTR